MNKINALTLSMFCVATLFASIGLGQYDGYDTNLISNPSMEEGKTIPSGWSAPRGSGVKRVSSPNAVLHLNASMAITSLDGGATPNYAKHFVSGLESNQRYILSVNMLVRSGVGVLKVAEADHTPIAEKSAEPAGRLAWQKVELEFETGPDTNEVSVFCVSRNASVANYFDLIKMIKADSLTGPGGFENGEEGWELDSPSSTGTTQRVQANSSFGGQYCLRLNNAPGQYSFATKNIFLSEIDHLKQFKLQAKIDLHTNYVVANAASLASRSVLLFQGALTGRQPIGGLGGADPCDGISDELLARDWLPESDPFTGYTPITHNRAIPDIPSPGVGFKVRCYKKVGEGYVQIKPEANDNSSPGTVPARINPPMYRGAAGGYHHFEHHFLVPEKTELIQIVAINQLSLIADFDNIRLSTDEVRGSERIERFGVRYNPVEAPLSGSFVSVTPGDAEDLQLKVNQATFPGCVDEYGLEVWVPPGNYLRDNLQLGSHLTLKMHPNAQMIRKNPPASAGFGGGFLTARLAPTRTVTDLTIEGGRYISRQLKGPAVAPIGCRIVVRNHAVPTWNDGEHSGSAFHLFGNDYSLHNNFIHGPGGPTENLYRHDGLAGLQFWGVTRASLMANQVYAGDDAIGAYSLTKPISVVDGVAYPNRFYDFSNLDIEAYNNRLDSHFARAISCGLAHPRQGEHRMSADTKNFRVRNFVGKCGGAYELISVLCIPAKNFTSSRDANGNLVYQDHFVQKIEGVTPGKVSNVVIENGEVYGDLDIAAQSENPAAPPIHKIYGFLIETRDSGFVEDVVVANVEFHNIAREPLRIRKGARFALTRPALSQVEPRDNKNIQILDSFFDAVHGTILYAIDTDDPEESIEPSNPQREVEVSGTAFFDPSELKKGYIFGPQN